MLSFLIILMSGEQDRIDDYGVMFEDSSRTILIEATQPFEAGEYSIPSTTAEIRGGSLEKGPFYKYRSSLKTLKFDNCFSLTTLGSYCFSELIIAEIDMSACVNLTYLSECCFKDCNNLASIRFPPHLETLKGGSLNGLDSITELHFPSSLLRIDGPASPFIETIGRCQKLQNVSWGPNPVIQHISNAAFAKDVSLRSIFIPASVSYMASAAFADCPLDKIEIDANNKNFSTDGTVIYDKLRSTLIFSPPSRNGTYVVNESVRAFSNNAFDSSKYSEVVLPPKLQSIASQCFMDALIERIEIGPSVVSISNSVFLGCTKLRAIVFNPSISKINWRLFYNCVKLNRLVIPGNVTIIGELAFMNCRELDYVFIPKSVTSIGAGAFAGINKSVVLDFEEGSGHRLEDSVLLSSDNKTFIAYIGDTAQELNITIGDSVETIGQQAFAGYRVSEVHFGPRSRLRVIGVMAFMEMPLKSICLPDTVEEIHEKAFWGCSDLSTVYFGASLKTIDDEGFWRSGISNILLPASTTSLGADVFLGCKSIRSFSYTNLREIGEKCFAESSIDFFTVKQSLVQIGKDSFSGSSLQNVIFEPSWSGDKGKVVSDYSFRNAKQLATIGFGVGTVAIGERAFEGCASIKNLRLSDTIESIGSRAFSGCAGLESVSLGEESVLRTIGSFAFEGCPKFIRFEVHEGNRHLSVSEANDVLFDKEKTEIIMYLPAAERRAFSVPATVRQIGAYSFQGAQRLEAVRIGEAEIAFIGFGAFNGCRSLREIDLPESVASIGGKAFEGCESLRCGSFIFNSGEQRERLKADLIRAGVPEESLYHCSTKLFSPGVGAEEDPAGISRLMVPSVLSSESEGENEHEEDRIVLTPMKINCNL